MRTSSLLTVIVRSSSAPFILLLSLKTIFNRSLSLSLGLPFMQSSSEELLTTSGETSLSSEHDDQLEIKSTVAHSQLLSASHTECIDALKVLQIAYNRLESSYLKRANELDYEFHQRYSHLFRRRADIVNGNCEPTDAECRLKTDCIDVFEPSAAASNDSLGIPAFWLQTLKQVPLIADTIQEWDEPLLKCLHDIQLRLQMEPIVGFTLEFHFSDEVKQYFKNTVLTKFYELQIESDDGSLFYEGAAIVRSIGCSIEWIDSSVDVTTRGDTGERQASFFHFFVPPVATGEHADDLKLATDFQIGHYIRENIISKAVLFYTGEIFENDYDLSDDESDERRYSFVEETGDGEHR